MLHIPQHKGADCLETGVLVCFAIGQPYCPMAAVRVRGQCPASWLYFLMGVNVSDASVYLLALLHLTPASFSVYHILLYKRDTRSALGWIMACLFIPYGGPLAYYFFGINRVRTRARGLKHRLFSIEHEGGRSIASAVTGIDRRISAIGFRITGTSLSTGNTIRTYHNGEQAYPAMLAAIHAARRRVLLTTYILKSDTTGDAFSEALAAAVDRNVEVKVLVDGVGEWYSRPRTSKQLKKSGIPVARFLPPKLLPPSIYLNLRNHRKLLVLDNDLAFAGGMNISDEQTSFEDQQRKVSDIHFSLQGPVVDSLAKVFYEDWSFATGSELAAQEPSRSNASGTAACRVIPDGPDEDLDALALTIQSVIAAASETVDIMTPYFLPNRELISALQSASLRGVRVRVVLPAENNLFYVHWASRNVLAELLAWDIEAYYQPAPFCHSKLLCVDQQYSMIGSANLDPRSLRLNFELGVEVFCTELNAELRSHFEATIADSSRIDLQQLRKRPVRVRLADAVSGLFTPYL